MRRRYPPQGMSASGADPPAAARVWLTVPAHVYVKGTPMRVLIAVLLLSASVVPAGAQPFSNAVASRAKYSVSDTTPSRTCDSLSTYTGEGIVSIAARVVAATADTPQHCRLT